MVYSVWTFANFAKVDFFDVETCEGRPFKGPFKRPFSEAPSLNLRAPSHTLQKGVQFLDEIV